MSSLQTVGRTLKLLSIIGTRPVHGWTLAELYEETKFSKPMLLRMLTTLEEHKYLSREPASKRYRLGPALLELGTAAAMAIDLRQIAIPEMKELMLLTRQTILLHVPSLPDAICIEKIEGDDRPVSSPVGHRSPLWAGSAGKVILAFLTEAQRAQVLPQLSLERFTERTITDRNTLMQEIEQIQQQGYARSQGEFFPVKTSALSVPIWNRWGLLEGGLTLVGVGESWKEEDWQEYSELARAAARRISAQLGCPEAFLQRN